MQNKYIIFGIVLGIIVIIFLVYNTTTTGPEKSLGYKTITSEDAKIELDNDNSIILIDVRTQPEYNEGHIENSILIPLDELESRIINVVKDKNTKLFVYCKSGGRSKTASNLLIDLGYTNVYDLGGILDWKYDIITSE